MFRTIVRFASLLLLAGLCACTSLPEPASEPTFRIGPPLDDFVAYGRLAVTHDGRSNTLRFRWSHTPDHDEVLFLSPLGQGLAELRREPGRARLVQPGKPDLVEPGLEHLSRRLFGTALPLQRLTEWMRGAVPGPSEVHAGWQVQAAESMQWRGHTLVKRLEARQGETMLRLAVEQWGDEPADDAPANDMPGTMR